MTADLEQFTRQLAEIADRRVSAASAGQHVSGTAQRGQVLEVSVDPGWAARSRTSEIESELAEVLRELRRRSTPGDDAADGMQGPTSALGGVTVTAADVSEWAADAGVDQLYEQARAQMETLLQQGAENFRAIATSLDDMAESIEDFWQAIVIAFASFLVGAVAAIASAFGVVTIPAGIPALLGAVGAGLGFIFQVVQAIDSHMDVIRDQTTTVQQGRHDIGAEWKQSNITAMSDASVADGDGSDWRPFQ